MQRFSPSFATTRRSFALMMGAGLFGFSNRLADAVWQDLTAESQPERRAFWTIGENRLWWWYERHKEVDDDWKMTGITTPIHKETGKPYTGQTGYLDEGLVTERVRKMTREVSDEAIALAMQDYAAHQADAERQARDGRPPSVWIRGLTATELRIWLRTIEVPEVGVSGMSCWCHLTRDHSFDPVKIEGLTQAEQDELHAAAHFGY